MGGEGLTVPAKVGQGSRQRSANGPLLRAGDHFNDFPSNVIICFVKRFGCDLFNVSALQREFDPDLGFSCLGFRVGKIVHKSLWITPLAPSLSEVRTNGP